MENTMTAGSQLSVVRKYGVLSASFLAALSTSSTVSGQHHERNIMSTCSDYVVQADFMQTRTLNNNNAYAFPQKRNFMERYRKIAASEWFKRTHSDMSLGEVMSIED